jgi:hypothetical protein
MVFGRPVPATAPVNLVPSNSGSNPVASPAPKLQLLQYAAAVLKGEDHMLEFFDDVFVSNEARIKKNEEGWILESSEFSSCTTGEQVFPIADDIVARMHHVMSLYCGAEESLSVEHIYWVNAAGEKLRTIRCLDTINVISSKGLAELQTVSKTQPLASAVLQAMTRDVAVKEAFALHGKSGLSWSQVYDIIEFLGGAEGIDKVGYASKAQTRKVRQTANHYRHLGNPKSFPLPSKPPTLADATEFARDLLKRYLASRL